MLELFLLFLKIGAFTFGGGYAMIAQIKEYVVDRKGWLSDEELMEVIVIAESTPGPIAINLATYVGYKRKGFWGSLCATVGVVLPSLVLLFVLSLVLEQFMQNRFVQYAFVGIQCAVAFLIFKAGIEMFCKMPKNVFSILLFCTVLLLSLVLELSATSISTVYFILVGGVAGLFLHAIARLKGGRK